MFNKPYVPIGPVYSKNCRNYVALNFEYESRALGRLANSEGQYFLRIFNLADITEISLPIVSRDVNIFHVPMRIKVFSQHLNIINAYTQMELAKLYLWAAIIMDLYPAL